jgi:hypothetical protein
MNYTWEAGMHKSKDGYDYKYSRLNMAIPATDSGYRSSASARNSAGREHDAEVREIRFSTKGGDITPEGPDSQKIVKEEDDLVE